MAEDRLVVDRFDDCQPLLPRCCQPLSVRRCAFPLRSAYTLLERLGEVLARCRGYRMKEIPIVFLDRVGGRSKLKMGTLLTTLALVPKWRWQGLWRKKR